MNARAAAAVDLGATSGRVLVGTFDRDAFRVADIARFPNRPVRTPDGLHWSILELHRQVLEGLASAAHTAPGIASIGIDGWAIDYGLLRGGRLLGPPYSYRDERWRTAADRVHARIPAPELYQRNGLQHLPFTTIHQLVADQESGILPLVDRLLLLPDLFTYWLTGVEAAERTNASTTGLLSVTSGQWDVALADLLGIPAGILPPVIDPGTELGALTPEVGHEIGAPGVPVVAVGSHDTASAVVAVPATGDDFAYISCGTWSLVGVELEQPVRSEAARRSGFTNEAGVDGRTRFLHNVMGLWLLTESIRHWQRTEPGIDLDELLGAAAAAAPPAATFDPDDECFLAPGDMPARIADWLTARDLPVPRDRAELVRCILQSLAEAYADAIHRAAALSGRAVRTVHLVGGGSRNALLCRLTANATGLPVIAGPIEASAIGNLLVQARALGWVRGGLEDLRRLVARSIGTTTYLPGGTVRRPADETSRR